MDPNEALQRLRAADPAAGVDGAWDGSPAQDLAASGVAPARSRTALLSVIAAAAVVLAVAAGTGLLHRAGTPAGSGTAQTTPISTTTAPPSGDHLQRADALLAALLAGVPPLPGASPADAPPVPALKGPAETPGSSPNVLEHGRWWTARGSVDDALEFYRAHPPDGLAASGSASGGNTSTGEIGPDSLSFDSPDTGYARSVQVLISMIAYDGGVAVGAYAQGVWIPERDPATVLSAVSGVDVVVTRHSAPGRSGAPTVTRSLDSADAQTLVEAVNALAVRTPGVFHCPAQFGGVTDDLGFATAAGSVRVVEELTGCGGVTVKLPDGSTHDFESGKLDQTLMVVLGLPQNYGQ